MSNDSSKRVPASAVSPTTGDASARSAKPGQRWPGVLGTVFSTAAVFILGQAGGAALVLLLALFVAGGSAADDATLFGSSVLLQFAFAVVVYGVMTWLLWLVLRRRQVSFADLGFAGRPRWREAGWAVVAFVSYMAAYAILLTLVTPLVPGLDVDQRQDVGFDGADGLSLVLVFLALAVAAPIAEELLMRGFMFTALRRKLRFWGATLITSAVFAALHLNGGEAGAGPLWIAAVDTFVLSGVLCYLREKTGRLWAGIGVHMIKNSLAFLLLFVVGAAG